MTTFLRDCASREIANFIGPAPLSDQYDLSPEHALKAENVRYIATSVGTRLGHAVALSASEVSSNLYNWLYTYSGALKNALLYHKPGTGIRYQNLASGSTSTIISETGGVGASMAGVGQHVYVAFHDASGIGIAAAQVYGFGVTIGADKLFAPPLTVVPTTAEPGAGLITAGDHKIGYLIETRNGFITRPSPTSFDEFVPVTVTASGSMNLQVTVNTTWPDYAWKIHIIMTTVDNLNQYWLVPGAELAVPGGQAYSAAVTFSISDDDLAATGTDAEQYLSLLTQTTSGTAPFLPSVIVLYSNRACYITRDALLVPVCYISEPDNYQTLTADQHAVYLPGNLIITTGFVLRNTLYLLGPHWTYALNDSGDVPALWGKPELVDGRIGALGPNCVFPDASQGSAWIADTGGLYLYQGGPYPEKPISYYQTPDWNRINWGVPTKIFIIDNKDKKEVKVLAPLDGATTPSHIFCWNYTNGLAPEVIKYSLDSFSGGYTPNCAAMIQNDTTKRIEPWYGCSTSGPIIREREDDDATPYRDVDNSEASAAIDCPYETALLPGMDAPRGGITMAHAARLRLRGSGNLTATVWALDHERSTFPNNGAPIALSDTPGREEILKFKMNSEQASLELSTNAVDEWWSMAWMAWFYTEGPAQR